MPPVIIHIIGTVDDDVVITSTYIYIASMQLVIACVPYGDHV